MGKYQSYRTDVSFSQRKLTLNPIWRGVGFLLMVLVPIASYFIMQEILAQNAVKHWFQIPQQFLSPWVDPLLFIKIFVALVAVVAIYAILLLIGFTYDKLFGPPHYGPTDAPPSDPGIRRN